MVKHTTRTALAMRRTLTLRVDGAEVEYDSVWRGHERLRPIPPPREMPRFCPECWHPLTNGRACAYCAGIRRAQRIQRLLSSQLRGRWLRRRLLGFPGRCGDCGAKLPEGAEAGRCGDCLELSRCRNVLSGCRISVGLCYVCGERAQAVHPDGRLSTRCERCLG